MTNYSDLDACIAENLVTFPSPLICIIFWKERSAWEIRQLFRAVNTIIEVCGVDALDPCDWPNRSLALALRLSLKDSESDSAKTQRSSQK